MTACLSTIRELIITAGLEGELSLDHIVVEVIIIPSATAEHIRRTKRRGRGKFSLWATWSLVHLIYNVQLPPRHHI